MDRIQQAQGFLINRIMENEVHPFVTNRWLENIKIPNITEKWHISKDKNQEVLSFAYMPNKEVKSIILGTFPIWEIVSGPISSRNFEFFYGSIVNDFWSCLGHISHKPINDVKKRIEILDGINIGITDILHVVNRSQNNCNSDNCLDRIKYNNIVDLTKHYPLLKNIFVTSGGAGPVANLNENNRSVVTWLKDSLQDYHLRGFNIRGFVKHIAIGDFEFNLIYLFSPSNMANIVRQRELNENLNFGIQNISIQEYRRLQWNYFLNKYHFENKNKMDETFNNCNLEYLFNFFEH